MSATQNGSGDQERYSRRLSDKIQAAFDHACDEGELIVAGELLQTLELVLLRVPPRRNAAKPSSPPCSPATNASGT